MKIEYEIILNKGTKKQKSKTFAEFKSYYTMKKKLIQDKVAFYDIVHFYEV